MLVLFRSWTLADLKGSITSAVQSVRRVAGFSLLVNVECQSQEEADEAITAGANIVMLDNIVGEELHSTAKALKDKWRGKREFLIETSGGIVEGGLVARLGPGKRCSRPVDAWLDYFGCPDVVYLGIC